MSDMMNVTREKVDLPLPWYGTMGRQEPKVISLIRKYLPDLIYGANDGIVTSIAVVASVSGASLPSYVALILGFSNLFADGLSMAASDYLSNRSQPGESYQMSREKALYHGVAAFTGFTLAGIIPLAAYLFPSDTDHRFFWASLFALTTLFIIGAVRSFFTHKNWVYQGLEMLVVGMAASGLAYAIGMLGARLMNVVPQ